jgi:uncharacterized flavoprotein (TIGR03862 family)
MPHMPIPMAAIIGGGPAGLMAAQTIAAAGHAVTLYEHMPTLGRKLLMAGRGGLNLTHSEPADIFVTRYGKAAARLAPLLAVFPPQALTQWCHGLGEATFVGSSGRVFPRALKASPLLRAWLARLASLGVRAAPRHRWLGWTEAGDLAFATPQGDLAVPADAVVLACGGASWPRLGSDGRWTEALPDIAITPLRPANCGFTIPWSAHFRQKFEGQPLKRIALAFAGQTSRGEALITAQGIEGGAVYALSAAIRESCPATISLDLRPDLPLADLAARLAAPRAGLSLSNFLRRAGGLSPVAIGLVQEALHTPVQPGATPPSGDLATLIKTLPLRLLAPTGLARAISTAGGIAWEALDDTLMLRARPGVFACGEMIDWEAPTGGYLLQACFSTGAAAGRGAVAWLDRHKP